MQENDTSVKGSTPAPKPIKYRLACDNCQQSKIRCDQERPKCRRCAKKDMECVYSPAKRAGRPRTRNNSKGSTYSESSTSASQNAYPTPIMENGVPISAMNWMSLPATDNCSNSSSGSNISTFPSLAQTFQMSSPEDLDFSLYQQSDEDFLQTLSNFTVPQCVTPKQNINCSYATSPGFHIAPELLNLDFRGAFEQPEQQDPQQDQRGQEQHEQSFTTMFLDEGLPYFGLVTPEDLQPIHHPEKDDDMSISSANNNYSMEACSQAMPPIQQEQPQSTQPSDQASFSSRSCKCVTTLLDHLPTSPHSPTSSSLDSISAALSTSRTLISSCCTAIACPNACSTRPSAALVICEAIDRALISLRLSGTSLWHSTHVSASNYEKGTCSPPSASSSPLSSNSRGHDNDIMLPSSLVDEEHEPLRCGSLPIRGADRRAVVRVLLVKRVLEVQGVLERLREILLSGSLVGGDVAIKKPLLRLCADVVGEFAVKVSERAETVKLQM